MLLDAFALEPHFVDHAAPVWRALPPDMRGTFYVDQDLVERAAAKGVDATAIDAQRYRMLGQERVGRPQGRKALVASIGDQKVARRLGYGDFARLEHGAGQAYRGNQTGSYAGSPGNDDASLVLVPNDYSADLWRRAYPQASVVIVGCPKLDDLPRKTRSADPVVAFTWHWPGHGIAPENASAFLEYAPAVVAYVRKHPGVVFHGHPRWAAFGDRPRLLASQLGVEYVDEFEDVCRRADVLVFDNSSVGFEFAATGRPVVVVNASMYSRRAQHGGRFWDWSSVGVQCDAPEQLVSSIAAALDDAPAIAAERERVVSLVYAHREGAAVRAAAALSQWAREAVPVAA